MGCFVNEHLSDDNDDQNTLEPITISDTELYTEANIEDTVLVLEEHLTEQ